jgi:hypothetical protein
LKGFDTEHRFHSTSGNDVIGQAHRLKILEMARLGELLKRLEKRGPQHSRRGGSKGSQREPLPAAPPTLAELGVSKRVSMQAHPPGAAAADARSRGEARNQTREGRARETA